MAQEVIGPRSGEPNIAVIINDHVVKVISSTSYVYP